MNIPELCACPKSWEPLRRTFRKVILADKGSSALHRGLSQICAEVKHFVVSSSGNMQRLLTGSYLEQGDLLRTMKKKIGGCFPGVATGAYACMLSYWLSREKDNVMPMISMAAPLLTFAAGCLEPHNTKWRITTGHAVHQLLGIMFEDDVNLLPGELALCSENMNNLGGTLIGYCGYTALHTVHPSIVGPLQPIASSDVVLCTHTSTDALHLVEHMLISWGGASSVALLDVHSEDRTPILNEWAHHLSNLGANQVVLSLVSEMKGAKTDYDRLYPANVLRQIALDAAVGDMVLLADPGFLPSAGFHSMLKANSQLGEAVRGVLDAHPTALLVSSFLIFEEMGLKLTVAQLQNLIDKGSAAPFDAYVCPRCRPHAWQWLFLTDSALPRFHEVGTCDLHHPAWILYRSLLPRLPGFLHGVVKPRTGKGTIGWTGLPYGLKALSDQLISAGVKLLLLPGFFLYRQKSLPLPSRNADLFPNRFPVLYFDLLYRRFHQTLPIPNRSRSVSRNIFWKGHLTEVVPQQMPTLFTIKRGVNTEMQLLVIASIIVGSEELQRLAASVPWTVHAVAVGAKDWWATAKRDLPVVLRNFPSDTLVAVVDAYDMVLLPCGRSIPEEFARFRKNVVIASEITCWPNAGICHSCGARYNSTSREYAACLPFPNVNSGGYMGTAASLAHVFGWMHEQGPRIGEDDQENAWHYYNAFPEKVALDHGQRIWSTLLFCDPAKFRVQGCTIYSDYVQGPVCFVHANGGSKDDILAPLLQELEARGCRERPAPRKVEAYAGLTSPTPMVELFE